MSYILNPCFFPIDPFDGSNNNFRRWKERILLRLRTLELAYVLEPQAAESAANKNWEDDDSLCRLHILNTLTDSLYGLHRHRKTAKQLWVTLERMYGIDDEVSKLSAMDRFIDFEIVDDDSVLEQVCKIESIVSEIVSQGLPMDGSLQVSTIIEKLLPSWERFETYFYGDDEGANHDYDNISMDQLWDLLRRGEMRRGYEKDKKIERRE